MTSEDLVLRLRQMNRDALIDALASLAERDESVLKALIQFTSGPEEKLRRFKSKLAGLRRSKKVLWGQESQHLARELKGMVELLSIKEIPPKAGVDALESLFQSQNSLFGRCDDSSGVVSSVFRNEATSAFVGFASRWGDKRRLEAVLENLLLSNDRGACDRLAEQALEMLPEEAVRRMIRRIADRASAEPDETEAFQIRRAAEALAISLGDPQLYLELVSPKGTPPLDVHLLQAAHLFLQSGEPAEALAMVHRMSERTLHLANKKQLLLVKIHQALGNRAELEALLRASFFAAPCALTLEPLAALSGEKGRRQILEDFRSRIADSPDFSPAAALFLCETGFAADAAAHVLKHREKVDGANYYSLLPLAKNLEGHRLYLPAIVLYRALLETVLKATLHAAYGHAARYLYKLGQLAPFVEDWQSLLPHTAYEAGIRFAHARKSSFWKRYAEVAEAATGRLNRGSTKPKAGLDIL